MTRRLITIPAVAIAWVLFGAAPALASGGVHADFNGDGRSDLAVGVPHEDVGSIVDAGAVQVIYGSGTGLTATGDQVWTQNSATPFVGAIADAAESDDLFGAALAAGDFNGDGFDDLAVGVPREDLGSVVNAGAVNVIYGSPKGLTEKGNQFWTQNSAAGLVVILDQAETGDRFGAALAAANFGKTSQADLAVGVPSEDVGSIGDAGAVNVIYGSSTGLGYGGNQFWNQNSISGLVTIQDSSESGDNFGSALAAANLGGSAEADLAVGVPTEDLPSLGDAGGVNVIYGSSIGLGYANNQFWTQNSATPFVGAIADSAEPGDRFGSALATANLGRSAEADLAIGVPYEDVGSTGDAGAVNVIYGSSTGLGYGGNQFWNQNSGSILVPILDSAETGDHFGFSLAAADLGHSAEADLAVGVPHEDLPNGWGGTTPDKGATNVIYGSSTGLTAMANQFLTVVPTTFFSAYVSGYALTAGAFKGGVQSDLAVGAPRSILCLDTFCQGWIGGVGEVDVFLGSTSGLSSNKTFGQGWGGILDTPEANDQFGEALP
jgi:hypothetical protein